MWSAYHNPKAMYNLKFQISSKLDLFDPKNQFLQKLHNSVEDYLEQK